MAKLVTLDFYKEVFLKGTNPYGRGLDAEFAKDFEKKESAAYYLANVMSGNLLDKIGKKMLIDVIPRAFYSSDIYGDYNPKMAESSEGNDKEEYQNYMGAYVKFAICEQINFLLINDYDGKILNTIVISGNSQNTTIGATNEKLISETACPQFTSYMKQSGLPALAQYIANQSTNGIKEFVISSIFKRKNSSEKEISTFDIWFGDFHEIFGNDQQLTALLKQFDDAIKGFDTAAIEQIKQDIESIVQQIANLPLTYDTIAAREAADLSLRTELLGKIQELALINEIQYAEQIVTNIELNGLIDRALGLQYEENQSDPTKLAIQVRPQRSPLATSDLKNTFRNGEIITINMEYAKTSITEVRLSEYDINGTETRTFVAELMVSVDSVIDPNDHDLNTAANTMIQLMWDSTQEAFIYAKNTVISIPDLNALLAQVESIKIKTQNMSASASETVFGKDVKIRDSLGYELPVTKGSVVFFNSFDEIGLTINGLNQILDITDRYNTIKNAMLSKMGTYKKAILNVLVSNGITHALWEAPVTENNHLPIYGYVEASVNANVVNEMNVIFTPLKSQANLSELEKMALWYGGVMANTFYELKPNYEEIRKYSDNLIKNIPDPVNENDAVNKKYVDNKFAIGQDISLAVGFGLQGLPNGMYIYVSGGNAEKISTYFISGRPTSVCIALIRAGVNTLFIDSGVTPVFQNDRVLNYPVVIRRIY